MSYNVEFLCCLPLVAISVSNNTSISLARDQEIHKTAEILLTVWWKR